MRLCRRKYYSPGIHRQKKEGANHQQKGTIVLHSEADFCGGFPGVLEEHWRNGYTSDDGFWIDFNVY